MYRLSLCLLSTLAVCSCQLALAQSPSSQLLAYTVPAGFPTSLFPAYYIPPSPTQEVGLPCMKVLVRLINTHDPASTHHLRPDLELYLSSGIDKFDRNPSGERRPHLFSRSPPDRHQCVRYCSQRHQPNFRNTSLKRDQLYEMSLSLRGWSVCGSACSYHGSRLASPTMHQHKIRVQRELSRHLRRRELRSDLDPSSCFGQHEWL